MPTPRDRLVLEAIATHGRLTREHIRQLFFRHPDGAVTSIQAVNARLRKLAAADLVDPVVVASGRGSGPYAYALTARGRATLTGSGGTHRAAGGPVWHQLEIADFRVSLQMAMEASAGALIEWRGEPVLRSLLVGRRGWPMPDALVHWRLTSAEGTFLLEWDRGSETLAILTSKMARYDTYWRARGHRELLPGLGLRPRLAIVVKSNERAGRLIHWVAHRQHTLSTVFVGVAEKVMSDPLGSVWWRSDTDRPGALVGL